eukprot:GILI01034758.1.p1 GENE.GILI01034758.1~~GILI01034758.1.p1  ORF type:complete len:678 (+),score=210.97 GILI01034758.1:97-2034(+)
MRMEAMYSTVTHDAVLNTNQWTSKPFGSPMEGTAAMQALQAPAAQYTLFGIRFAMTHGWVFRLSNLFYLRVQGFKTAVQQTCHKLSKGRICGAVQTATDAKIIATFKKINKHLGIWLNLASMSVNILIGNWFGAVETGWSLAQNTFNFVADDDPANGPKEKFCKAMMKAGATLILRDETIDKASVQPILEQLKEKGHANNFGVKFKRFFFKHYALHRGNIPKDQPERLLFEKHELHLDGDLSRAMQPEKEDDGAVEEQFRSDLATMGMEEPHSLLELSNQYTRRSSGSSTVKKYSSHSSHRHSMSSFRSHRHPWNRHFRQASYQPDILINRFVPNPNGVMQAKKADLNTAGPSNALIRRLSKYLEREQIRALVSELRSLSMDSPLAQRLLKDANVKPYAEELKKEVGDEYFKTLKILQFAEVVLPKMGENDLQSVLMAVFESSQSPIKHKNHKVSPLGQYSSPSHSDMERRIETPADADYDSEEEAELIHSMSSSDDKDGKKDDDDDDDRAHKAEVELDTETTQLLLKDTGIPAMLFSAQDVQDILFDVEVINSEQEWKEHEECLSNSQCNYQVVELSPKFFKSNLNDESLTHVFNEMDVIRANNILLNDLRKVQSDSQYLPTPWSQIFAWALGSEDAQNSNVPI